MMRKNGNNSNTEETNMSEIINNSNTEGYEMVL